MTQKKYLSIETNTIIISRIEWGDDLASRKELLGLHCLLNVFRVFKTDSKCSQNKRRQEFFSRFKQRNPHERDF